MFARKFVVFALVLQCTVALAQLDDTKAIMGVYTMPGKDARKVLEGTVPARLLPKDGMLVLDVTATASKQGAQPLDLLLTVNRKRVRDQETYKAALEGASPGERVEVTFKRFIGVWKSMKGDIELTTERKAAYDSIYVTCSKVEDTYRAELSALRGDVSVISPIISLRDGKPSLSLKVQWAGEDWLFMESLGLRLGSKKATIELGFGRADTQVVDNGVNIETYNVPMLKEVEEMLRDDSPDRILARFSGKSEYVESELSEQWHARVKLMLAIYDDIKATNAGMLIQVSQ